MKKIFPIITLAVLFAIPFAGVHAQTQAPSIFKDVTDMLNVIRTLRNWLFTIVIVIAVVFLIYAGFQYITSGGDTKKIEGARAMIVNVVIGLVIAIAAIGLVNVVGNILGWGVPPPV